jgi:hypothetical protein
MEYLTHEIEDHFPQISKSRSVGNEFLFVESVTQFQWFSMPKMHTEISSEGIYQWLEVASSRVGP